MAFIRLQTAARTLTKDRRVRDEFVIDACRWHVDAEAPAFKQRALEHFQARYKVLLRFLVEEGLLKDPRVENVVDWKDFELRASQLTPDGLALLRACHHKWNPAFGHGHTHRHLTQWKRRLREFRKEARKP